MPARAKFFGINEIMEVFENEAKKPYWALYEGKTLHRNYTGEDMQEALTTLQNELTILRNRKFTNVFILHPHTVKLAKGDSVYSIDQKKYPVSYPIYCTVFTEIELQNLTGTGQGAAVGYYQAAPSGYVNERLNAMESTLNAIATKLKDDENEEEEEENDSEMGQISKLLENDTVKTLIGAFVGYLTKGPQKMQTVTSLGKINEEWEQCVNILFAKGVTLEHLQKLAAMPESKIKMLLSML